MDFNIIFANLGLFLHGLKTTVVLVSASLALGLCIAVPCALIANSQNPLLRWPVWAYSYFFRGTPLLVQIYLLYFGSGQFDAIRASFAWPVLREAYWCALIAFTLNTGAYTTEILRGAIKAMPFGEIEAAKASGMSWWQMIRRIVLPSAFRRALPAYSNEVIFMIHGSAVAGAITIVDLFGAAKKVYSDNAAPWEAFITAGVIYFVLVFAFIGLFKLLEKRWFAHLRPRT